MFTTVKNICALVDKRIEYVKVARLTGLGDRPYFKDMERLIKAGLNTLKVQSTDKKLIAKYERKVSTLFKDL